MEISIIGFSSIVSRKVIPSLLKIKDLKKINIFSRRNIDLNFENKNEIEIKLFDISGLKSFIKSNKSLFYYVSTENSNHFYYSKLLLELKQNVLIDKPIVLSIKEFNVLLTIAKSNNCYLDEVLNWQYHKQVNFIKEFIKRNKNINVISRFTIPLPAQNSFRVNEKYGSGVFWDMSSYLFSTLLLFTEEIPILCLSKNIGSFKPQWIKAYLNESNIKFDGLFGFGFNYQNKLELISESEILIFDRIYTSDPSSYVNIYQITNDSYNNHQILDDAFYNYFEKTINSIINEDLNYPINKMKVQYKNIFNSNFFSKDA